MFFHEILEAKPDPIFGLADAFRADVRPNKVNLIIGIYKDDQLQSHIMRSMQKAKQRVLEQDLVADYLPLDGLPAFCEGIGALVFGESIWKANHSRIYAAQAVGGTGALQIGEQFLAQEVTKEVAIPLTTWPTHRLIVERAGCKVSTYPYYNRKTHGIDFSPLCSALKELPKKTAVLLQPVCHNPTGSDPSFNQWKEISQIIKEKQLIPFFDFAYQGFGEGLEKDRKVIELFFNAGHEMLIAYSCSKNFSMYCQRAGALFVVSENAAVKLRIGSQMKRIIRSLYSNPPAHGVRAIVHLLQDPMLKEEWTKELDDMYQRIHRMRENLVQRLQKSGLDFQFLRERKGMFAFLDLDKSQVQRLIDDFGVYLLENGRISLAGLTAQNLDYVVDAIASVCK